MEGRVLCVIYRLEWYLMKFNSKLQESIFPYIYIYTLVTIIFNVSQKNLLKKNKIARHRYSHMLRVRFLELRKKVI
jgi:hypothetical protein